MRSALSKLRKDRPRFGPRDKQSISLYSEKSALLSQEDSPALSLFTPGSIAPWGSVVPPDYVKKADEHPSISSASMKDLFNEYLPEEGSDVVDRRIEYHKRLSRCIKKRDWARFDSLLDEMSGVEPDEITFIVTYFGKLLSKGLKGTDLIVKEIEASEMLHPSLKRFIIAFHTSMIDFDKFDCFPSEENIRKSMKPFWEVAVQIKQARLRSFRRIMEEKVNLGELELREEISREPPKKEEKKSKKSPSAESVAKSTFREINEFWGERKSLRQKATPDTEDRLRALQKKGGLGWMAKLSKKGSN